jgi:sulfofructose kinase
MKTAYDLIAFGRTTIDILNLVDHFPSGEEIIRVKESDLQGGGPIATAAAAAARLGLSVAVIDCIGDDWRGQMILDGFRQVGVSTDLLQVAGGCSSTQSVILVEAASGRRSIINARGSAPEPKLNTYAVQALEQCKVLHVASSYPVPSYDVMQITRNAGGKICFDGGSGLFHEPDRELLPGVDWCITSRLYAEQYTGQAEIPAMLKTLKADGPQVVGITDGSHGCWYINNEGNVVHQPATRLGPVVDTTGCGDAFHGGFIFGMLRYGIPSIAFEIASVVAAFSSLQLGGRQGLPDFQQVKPYIHP